jgi:predicted small integral membrane protein
MAAKRALILAGAVSLAVWSLILLDVALSYRGGDGSPVWVARVVFLVVAALATLVVVFAVRRGWRRARARPLPDRGLNGWLVRQPGWRLAFAVWIPYGAVIFGTLFGMSISTATCQGPRWLPG